MQEKFKPNKHFFKFLKAEYSRRKYGHTTSEILPSVQEKLLCAAYGVTAWLFTKNGARWLFALMGMEEVEPHHAFVYYYNLNHEKKKLDNQGSLRIFRKSPKERAGIPRVGIDIAKRVVYSEGWKLPEDAVFEFVFEQYRAWLWDTHGQLWLKDNFTAIRFIDNHQGIAYRFETKEGQTYWFEEGQIISEPHTSKDCECCEYEFPCCDNYTGMGRLCNRCYAEHFAEPDVLHGCNRHECYLIECHNYLTDKQYVDLVEGFKQLPAQWSVHG